MNNIIDNINYNAYLYQLSILNQFEKICNPLVQLGIKSFVYFKLFEDGRYLNLVNNLEFIKTYFLNIKDNGTFYTEQINKSIENKFHCCSIDNINKFDKDKDPILHLLHDFNMWNSFAIYKKNHPSYIECYVFQMTREDTEFSEFYLDNLYLLEHFCEYFNDRAKDIIDCSDQQKLAYFDQQFNFHHSPKEYLQAQQINKFLQETEIKNRILQPGEEILFSSSKEMDAIKYLASGKSVTDISSDLGIPSQLIEKSLQSFKDLDKKETHTNINLEQQRLVESLSPREKECFFYLLRGLTAKQIAQKLGRSYRTIETHREHIKNKLKCSSKEQLIELAFEHGLAYTIPQEI